MKMESELVPVSGASAPVMMVLNWAAPCTIKSTNQELQKALVGYLGTRQRFLGVMWSPTFNHSPGSLWMDQQRLEKDLAQANLNLDRKCLALYDCEGLDYRDRRPRFLEGRREECASWLLLSTKFPCKSNRHSGSTEVLTYWG